MTPRLLALGALAALAAAAACGGTTTPTKPGPVTPDPGPVVTNAPPVITRFTVQSTRVNTPPNFSEVLEDLPIVVDIADPEPSSIELKYNWSSSVGTVTGAGRSVTWKAPADAATPADVTIVLEVVETYTSQGKNLENRVSGTTTVRLHNSVKEVGEMARQFLLDFSDSRITDIPFIMRNFQPDCYGTADETQQVTDNRRNFEILTSAVEDPGKTTINFGGSCPFPGRNPQKADACSYIRADWTSRVKRTFDDLTAGQITTAKGIDHIASMYYRDQKRWRLCDSQYEGLSTLKALLERRGLVP